MSASIGAAVKAYLETKGLGIMFYKDAAPPGTKRPYGTIAEDIGLQMDPLEDGGPATGATATGRELVQLDLWQTWLKDDSTGGIAGTINEDPLLADRITKAIHGSRLLPSGTGAPPMNVYMVRQDGRIRILDREGNIVHHAYTLAVNRVI